MTFAKPNILLLLILTPVILFSFHYFYLKKEKILRQFFSKDNFRKIGVERSRWKLFIKSFLLAIIYSLIVIALAEPQYGFKEITFYSKGNNIFVAIDTSLSMKANDLKPNRITVAKRKIFDLITMAKGERISLVPFAGEPYILIPLTTDYNIFPAFLDIVNTDLIPVQGTNFYNLIKKITDITSKYKLGNVSLIILSDGEDFSGNIKEALKLCKSNNITIYSIGIGTPSPTPIPLNNGGFKKDKNGNVVTTLLNEKFLEDIALKTDGVYVKGTNTSKDIKFIYKKIKKVKNKNSMKKRIYFNIYQYFLLPALLLLFFYFIISEKRKREDVV